MHDVAADVVVLGGGDAGCAVARRSTALGSSVIVIDDHPVNDALEALESSGVRVVSGTGRIVSRTVVEVDGRRYRGGSLVVATGARPRLPKGITPDGRRVLTADDVTDSTPVPKSALIVGGGRVGCEVAWTWASVGCEVTLVEAHAQLLPGEYPGVSRILAESLRSRGVRVVLGETISTLDSVGSEVVLIAAGRVPNTVGLGLGDIGIEPVDGGIRVDEFCCTGLRGVFAVGDVVRGRRSGDAARAEADLVADVIAGTNVRPLDYSGFPRLVRSSVDVVAVGLTESEAEEWYGTAGVVTVSRTVPGDAAGTVMWVAAVDGPVLGVHLVGDGAAEWAAVARYAYEQEMPLASAVALVDRSSDSRERNTERSTTWPRTTSSWAVPTKTSTTANTASFRTIRRSEVRSVRSRRTTVRP